MNQETKLQSFGLCTSDPKILNQVMKDWYDHNWERVSAMLKEQDKQKGVA